MPPTFGDWTNLWPIWRATGKSPKSFARIFRDYQNEAGFKTWKKSIDRLLVHGLE